MVRDTLKQLLSEGLIRPLDYAFGEFICDLDNQQSPSIVMLSALLSRELGEQHICLQIDKLGQPFAPYYRFPDPTELRVELEQATLVASDASEPTLPIVFFRNRVYLQKYWYYEKCLADMLISRASRHRNVDETALGCMLQNLFPANDGNETDWQKVAVCLAAKCNLSIITGGPGTGKTTTVTRLLAVLKGLAKQQGNSLKIQLVAPTGKAAARLNDSIQQATSRLPVEFQQDLDVKCSTIHRLLGSLPKRTQFKHNARNQLFVDLVVIDEVSMVDLPLMCKLFEALPMEAGVVMLGDKDQLSSVEAGSVLSDICASVELENGIPMYSQSMRGYLAQFCPLPKQSKSDDSSSLLQDNLAILQKSHRFSENSGIGNLSKAFNQGNRPRALQILTSDTYCDVSWRDELNLSDVVQSLMPGYKGYLAKVRDGDLQAGFAELQRQQVLCAQRTGPFGVDVFNQLVEKELLKQQLIAPNQEFYTGRPVMLAQNNHQLGLFNGDIGIVMPDPDTPELQKVWFIHQEGRLHGVLPNRLPPHDTQFAMTIHKSQGSEFANVTMLLPANEGKSQARGLSRELLYTGLTRAKSSFQLIADKATLNRALSISCERSSGLQAHLR